MSITSPQLMHTVLSLLLRRVLPLVLFGFLFTAVSAAEAKINFNLPAGEAGTTLKQFAAQAKREILFPVQRVDNVKTNAVQGEFTVREGLDRLLAGTTIRVIEDPKTGALGLGGVASPNGPRRVAQPSRDHPGIISARREEGAALQLEKMEVTGLRVPGLVNEGVIPRRENEAMPFQVYDRQAIERSGAVNLAEFFRSYSGNAAQGLSTQSIYGTLLMSSNRPSTASEGIDLRGLGSNKTVVLLNGRRLYGSDSAGPDISRIPLSAVERIEVLTGAGAAIYGANAMGGAVNVILRKGYEQGELTIYAGTSTGGGGTELRATLFQGFTSKDGRLSGNVTLEHTHREDIRMSQRKYYLDAMARFAPGTPAYRQLLVPALASELPVFYRNGTPQPAITVPGVTGALYASVPAGYAGTTPTPADFTATSGNALFPGKSPRIDETILQPPENVTSANFQGEYSLIKDRLDFYSEVAWRKQVLDLSSPSIVGNSNLSAASALNPFRNDVTPGYVGAAVTVAYNPVDLPLASQHSQQETRRAVAGFKGKLGAAKEWAWALDYSHDENREASHFSSATTYLNQAVAQGFYNPVRDLSRFPNSTPLSQLLDTTDTHRKPEIDAVNLRLSGRLFTLPAGDVQISIGGEWRQERYYSDALTVFPPVVSPFIASIFGSTINGTVNASREARAAYAELNVPLLNEGNRVFLVHELSLSAAVRYESFGNFSYSSTFGDGTVSTVAPDNIHAAPLAVALKYAPNRHFALRASWSQSFISPTMTDLFSARTTLANGLPLDYFDPLLNTTVTAASGTVLATQGGNPSLKPETGYSLNYGVIFTPDWAWAKGLSLTLDYFRVTNDNLVANPELTTVLKDLPGRVTRDAGGNLIAYDVSALNVSRLVAGGFDAKLNWEFPAVRHGRFVWSAQATYYDTYERRLFPGDPSEQRISDRTFALALAANTPLRLKGQSALFWTAPENMLGLPGSFTTGLTARYVSHYKDHYNTGAYSTLPTLSAIDGDWVASSTEFDLQLSYSPAGEILREGGKTKAQNRSRTWFADTKFTLGVQNLADRRPSYTSSNPSFYSFFNDPRQRYTYLEIKKTY